MSKKLLLADDSITIQKVIQITFAHEDYDLTITDNGDTALAKAQELKPDLIMADVYMPGKNGYELATAIKQDPALQNTPVLLLAGSFEPFDEDKARSCQANDWIEKPFESQRLIDKVAELLSSTSGAAPEPQPEVETKPVEAAGPALEESHLADFDQPAAAEEVAAVPEESFGDISFAEETPVFSSEQSAAADDWSDVALEPEAVAPEAEETHAAGDEPAKDTAEDFSSVGQETAAGEEPASLDQAVEPDVFDVTEEEIMPLDDDDILNAEDLEPAPQEPTLAAWSRDATLEEDIFSEPSDQVSAVDDDVFAATETVFGEEPTAAALEPGAEEAEVTESLAAESVPAFVEPVAEPAPKEEPLPATEQEPEPAAVAATLVDAEAKAAALSEDEIEQIIEKVVTKVVEKLAGSILERVAWEVVPDLAEHLIREEIRKIKEAAA
ncbi:MAG: response regulator [Desulfuromonadales bacterium]|jgi:CheY-like chemotaxis protein